MFEVMEIAVFGPYYKLYILRRLLQVLLMKLSNK
jgi:hypothetical protein